MVPRQVFRLRVAKLKLSLPQVYPRENGIHGPFILFAYCRHTFLINISTENASQVVVILLDFNLSYKGSGKSKDFLLITSSLRIQKQ